jgi:hypothetical protein
MRENASPREIVDRQMAAYNARDIDAYCALYAPDAVISDVNDGKVRSRGMEEIRRNYTTRFNNSPNLHYDIKARMELGAYVIDHELVTGIGDEPLEVIAIYEVRDSLIQTVRFVRK